MLVSKPTHGGGAPLGIDLEAGVAKIVVRRPPPEPEQAPADDPTPEASEPGADTGAEPRR